MLADELTAWARTDLLAAYRVLCLVLYWSDQTAVTCVRDERSSLQAIAMRLDPTPRHPGPVRIHYASRTGEALQEALSLVPPEAGCVIDAPNTGAHQFLLTLQPVRRQLDEFLYAFADDQVPEVLHSVCRISAAAAPDVGLGEPWSRTTILGEPATASPIHCIVREDRAVAVAAAGYPTALTEEVWGVWVADELRRQGYGRAVVASATADIMRRGRTPLYETSADNVASQRLAESVGYAHLGSWLRLVYGEQRNPDAGRV